MCFQMVSIYNLENAGRKLKLSASFVGARMCSIIDSGEKGYKLPEQIMFNSVVLYLTLLSTETSCSGPYMSQHMGFADRESKQL